MKNRKTLTAVIMALAVGLLPQASHAMKIDSYFIREEAERDYKNLAKNNQEGLSECGMVAVATLQNRDILKIDFSTKKLTKEKPKNLTGYRTAFTAEVGGVNRRTKGYEKYKITKAEIISDWISRHINVNEFPSNSVQLGGYFANLLAAKKFSVLVQYDGQNGPQTQVAEISMLSEKGFEPELSNYVECANILFGMTIK